MNGEYAPTLEIKSISDNEQIEVRIRDNGNGIPKEVQEKLFNPFFTTKPTGMGTGLGLSIHTWGGRGHDSNVQTTINSDGTVDVACGTQDLGVGSRTEAVMFALRQGLITLEDTL